MIIDEAENLQEDLIRNNVGNDAPRTCVEHECGNKLKVHISRVIRQDGMIICLIYHWSYVQIIVISFNAISFVTLCILFRIVLFILFFMNVRMERLALVRRM